LVVMGDSGCPACSLFMTSSPRSVSGSPRVDNRPSQYRRVDRVGRAPDQGRCPPVVPAVDDGSSAGEFRAAALGQPLLVQCGRWPLFSRFFRRRQHLLLPPSAAVDVSESLPGAPESPSPTALGNSTRQRRPKGVDSEKSTNPAGVAGAPASAALPRPGRYDGTARAPLDELHQHRRAPPMTPARPRRASSALRHRAPAPVRRVQRGPWMTGGSRRMSCARWPSHTNGPVAARRNHPGGRACPGDA